MKPKISSDGRYNLGYFSISLILTVAFTQLFLYFYPFANLNFGPYNIHHLYVGASILILTHLLLLAGMSSLFLAALSGVGSGLILDQMIFLVATDGADLTYLTPLSLWGAIISTVIVLAMIGGIYYGFVQKRR